MFGQPNWKNLSRDIESEDRDFQARRTFCFREEKYVSVAKRRVVHRATCRDSYSTKGEKGKEEYAGFHSPSFPRFFCTPREIEIQFRRDELPFRSGIVTKN